MLAGLEKTEAHPRNKLDDVLPGIQLEVKEEEKVLSVTLDYEKHAQLVLKEKYYRMKVILLTWNNSDDEPDHTAQHSMWIHPTDKLKRYTFRFDVKENTTDYMLICDCIRAEEKGELRLPPKHSLKIISVGSRDKVAMEALEEWRRQEMASTIPEKHDWRQEDDGVAGEEK